jgi:hypothetical protein
MDREQFDFRVSLERLLYVIAIWLLIMVIMAIFSGCKQVEYVTVEKVRNDTTFITKLVKDSVWLHDSVLVREKGDTVRIEKWHTKYIEKVRVDTSYVATHDTIPQPYPVIKEVEKDLNWWQRLRLWIGNIGLLAILGAAVYFGVKLWKVYKIF